MKTPDQLTPAQKQMLAEIARGNFLIQSLPVKRPPANRPRQTLALQQLLQQNLQQQADSETVKSILKEH